MTVSYTDTRYTYNTERAALAAQQRVQVEPVSLLLGPTLQALQLAGVEVLESMESKKHTARPYKLLLAS